MFINPIKKNLKRYKFKKYCQHFNFGKWEVAVANRENINFEIIEFKNQWLIWTESCSL